MKRVFTTKKQKLGETGENIACRFLVKQSFLILDRNWSCKHGEIDIIVSRENKIHFIEVKSVSCENINFGKNEKLLKLDKKVFHETYRPEFNVSRKKLKKMVNTIAIFLEKKGLYEIKWQIDVISVYIDLKNKKYKLEVLDNIIV